MILEGYVRDKNNQTITNATLEIKGEDFITIYNTESDENGYYKFDIPEGNYPFLIAVKDYAVNCLEYWCQNMHLQQDMQLDVAFDKLEIYGLHTFRVKGGSKNTLMVYFRPMSLEKFQQGEQDIAPEITDLIVKIDGTESPVLLQNQVQEYVGGAKLTAYLIEVETPEDATAWNKLEIEIRDVNDNFGAASIFREQK